MSAADLVDRLRRSEDTGANRCLPCTVLNSVLAGASAVAVAAAVGTVQGRAAGAVAGAAVLLVSAGSSYLRGYLIPGTPWLTEAYVPDWLLRRFETRRSADAPPAGEFDVEAALVRAGAVAPCEDEDDLCLTDGFGAAWREHIDAVRSEDASRGAPADPLGVDTDSLAVEAYGDALVARRDGDRVGQWESQAAFLADVAAATELGDRPDGWAALDVRRRGEVLHGLRLFLDRCPACDGAVTVGRETVASCCRSVDVVAVSGRDCGARLFEVERSASQERVTAPPTG